MAGAFFIRRMIYDTYAGVKACGEDSVHVAALSVLSAVINGSVFEFAVIIDGSGGGLLESADFVTEIGLYFDFAGRKVSLEILLVVVSVPEAPLYIRKYLEILFPAGFVLDIKENELAGITHGDEIELADSYAVFRRTKAGIAHAVSALIAVQFCLGRLPSGVPDSILIFNIYVLSVSVVRHIIVTITCKPQKPCILIKGIASASIGDQSEEVLVPEIIDPGERSLGSCDHVLPVGVIEMSEFHISLHVFRF